MTRLKAVQMWILPDVCEVKLTQELEVLTSVSDNDDESGGSQEPTLDKLGYAHAVVNKKKRKLLH